MAALGGIALWAMTRPKRRLNNALQNHRRLHVTLGWGLLVGMLLFSATGLTWSQWAGGNVDKMRAAFGWLTPQVNTQLHGEMPMTHDPHAGHHMDAMAMAQHQPALQLAQFDQGAGGGPSGGAERQPAGDPSASVRRPRLGR